MSKKLSSSRAMALGAVLVCQSTLFGCSQQGVDTTSTSASGSAAQSAVGKIGDSSGASTGASASDGHRSDEYWRKNLDPWVYSVTRKAATEPPFANKYWNNHEAGIYKCSDCGAVLFDSKDKFESGTGWPSFTRATKDAVGDRADNTLNMARDEVICNSCGAHLGHVFDDGPAPTGKRFCINSASLKFIKMAKAEDEGKTPPSSNGADDGKMLKPGSYRIR